MKLIRRGYTLIEAVMVISLMAIFALGIGTYIATSLQSWVLVSARGSATFKANGAMNRILSEIRRVKKPQNIDFPPSSTSEVQFLDLSDQSVNFRQSGTNLMRNTDILATGLASPEGLRFTYLNKNGQATAVKNDIRSIRVWISISAGAQWTTLESSARIRNL